MNKEISTYSLQMLQQIDVLSKNYTCLFNNLISLAKAFLEFNKDRKEKLNQFYSTVITKIGIKIGKQNMEKYYISN